MDQFFRVPTVIALTRGDEKTTVRMPQMQRSFHEFVQSLSTLNLSWIHTDFAYEDETGCMVPLRSDSDYTKAIAGINAQRFYLEAKV